MLTCQSLALAATQWLAIMTNATHLMLLLHLLSAGQLTPVPPSINRKLAAQAHPLAYSQLSPSIGIGHRAGFNAGNVEVTRRIGHFGRTSRKLRVDEQLAVLINLGYPLFYFFEF